MRALLFERPGRPTGPTASVLTLGCKVNQFESAGMIQSLAAAGWRVQPGDGPADLTVINSCTVTHRADFETRALIRRARRANPDGTVVVTGCWAQTRSGEAASMPEVDLVLGQNEKQLLPEVVFSPDVAAGRRILTSTPGRGGLSGLGFPPFERTRAFFRIQDGCDAGCAYCIVPRARGRSRSLPAADVVAGLDAYADQGLREVVLTGIHLGAWGLDLDPPSGLAGLARRLADASRVRLRFSSIEPDELTDELIEISTSSSVFAPSFHLPLQSGSDRILAAMGRPYTAGLFEDLVRMLIGIDPLACIGADVLTGLPGETEEAFEETAALIGRLPLAYLHAFPYSPRPGTRAEKMPDPVDRRTAKDRVRVLRDISRDKTRDFYRRNIGRVRETLIENQPDPATGWARGLTDNYASVLLPRGGPPAGEIVPVRLLEIDGRGRLIGRAD